MNPLAKPNLRFFNTAGPVHCDRHYCLPPLERINLPEILSLIQQQKYFVLHAPRQVGKTSFLLALTEYLNESGQYACLYVNVEAAQTAREDVYRGIRAILAEMSNRFRQFLGDTWFGETWPEVLRTVGGEIGVNQMLSLWAERSAKQTISLIDEIDSLVGDTLIAVLRQLRAGYDKRPFAFPQSVMLCGVRDVRE